MRKTEYINRIINASDKVVSNTLKNTGLVNADNIYYNVRLNNNLPLSSMPVVFYENRVQPIMNKPDDYELAVVRFKLSTLGLPILIWASQPLLSVTLTHDGVDYTTPLTFINNGTANSVYGNSIFNFQEFLNIINLALQTSYDNLKIGFPLSSITKPPFLLIDHPTNAVYFAVEPAYIFPIGPDVFSTQIYFNEALYFFFPALQAFATSDQVKTYQIIVQDLLVNTSVIQTVPYLIMKSDYPIFALWNDYQSISFESNTIPIVPENQPAQTNVITALVTDFEPLEEENNRTSFQYFPQGPLRYYSLSSPVPLSQIDIRVYWQDRFGNSFPLYLPFGQVCTVKLLFRKKSTREFEDAFGTTLSLEDRR